MTKEMIMRGSTFAAKILLSSAAILLTLAIFLTTSVRGLEDTIRNTSALDTKSEVYRELFIRDTDAKKDVPYSRKKMSGTFTVLVARILANDSTPSQNKKIVSDKTFGTYGDTINLKSQFAACSGDKVELVALSDNVSAGLVDGVINVNINRDVSGTSAYALLDSISKALTKQLGGTPLEDISDFILYCIPKAVNPFNAFMKNRQISVYSDTACTSISLTMHHIGFGLGLWYSGRFEEKYGDTSCSMGTGKRAIYGHDSPQQCFNAAKNWQAEWFPDRVVSVDPRIERWFGVMIGSVDYNTAKSGQKIVVQIGGDSKFNYHVGFNSKKGANIGTDATLGNQIIITQQEIGRSYSTIVATLGRGDRYVCASDSLEDISAFEIKLFKINFKKKWANIAIKKTDEVFVYDVWAVTTSNKLIRKNGLNDWETVKSGVQHVSVSGDGEGVWIVTIDKVLKTQTSEGWETLEKGIEKVCVTLSGEFVWVVTSKNELLYKQGNGKWVKQGTNIIDVAVSENGKHLIASKINGDTIYKRGTKGKFKTINRNRVCRVNAINNRGTMYVICGINLWSNNINSPKWVYIDRNYAQVALVNNLSQPFWRIGVDNDLSEARCGKFEWNEIRNSIKYFAVRDLSYLT